MELELDHDACQGHGRCYGLAPELFDADDEGYALLRVEGPVPPDLERKAALAAANCPEFAIAVRIT